MCWAYFLDTLGCYLSFEPTFSTGIYDKYLSTSLIELNKISALATLCAIRASCYGEGWRSTHFSDIFYPQAPKGSMVYSNQLSTYLSSRYKLLFSTISTTTTGITLLAAKNPEKNDQNWHCSISIVLLLTYEMCWCFLKMHNTYELPHT